MPKLTLTTLVFLALAGPAVALSCIKPNMARSFNKHAADEQRWVLVEGQFQADLSLSDLTRQLPPRPGQPDPVPVSRQVTAEAQFTGEHLGARTSAPLDVRVNLAVECMSPWCGAFPPVRVPLLAFLSRDADGAFHLSSGLCPGEFLERPTEAQVSALRRCIEQGSCGASALTAFE